MVQALNGNAIGPVANPADSAGEQGQELNLGELLRALERRRRLALSVMAVSLFTGAALTFWARTFYPTFQGSFKLLVSDPINSEGQGSASSDDGIANVALQRSGRTNTSTLIEVLTSPLLLNPLEQKLGVEVGSVANRLTVTPSGGGRQGATEGVLVVSLLWPNPKEGEQILWRMSQEYLTYSLRQRQEKLPVQRIDTAAAARIHPLRPLLVRFQMHAAPAGQAVRASRVGHGTVVRAALVAHAVDADHQRAQDRLDGSSSVSKGADSSSAACGVSEFQPGSSCHVTGTQRERSRSTLAPGGGVTAGGGGGFA